MNAIEDVLAQSGTSTLDEDASDRIESFRRPLPFGQICLPIFDFDRSPLCESSRLIERTFRNVGSDDAMAMLGQEYAVSPFAVGDRQDFRSRGQATHLARQKSVGRGPEQIFVRRITLIPEGCLIRFSHGPLSMHP